MGCGAAKAAPKAEPPAPAEKERGPPPEQQPRAVAFDVPLGDTPPAAPPERFQKRAADCPTVTAEALRQKQAKAEQRRQEVLEERIRNSKMFSEKAMPVTVTSHDP
ncbi:uncharacterized protein LOC119375051 [Rhipicephalus sanguineus]|uniref:uncharacterized protein LOC119375051 n=1 Tax=Rhipicephalus sanguineus TaxID=34632 RepID=UPI0018954844|nr:uncharacterized protein LOC119375051 [Rhipicephalus sanguineus]